MKTLLLVFVVSALFIPRASALFLASVSGTTYTQVEVAGGHTRIKTEPFTADRIYREMGVSREDYVLTTDLQNAVLYLRPRRAADSNQAPIVVMHNLKHSVRGAVNSILYRGI